MPMPTSLRLPADPRWLQIAFLASFLTLGVVFYSIVPLWEPPLVLATTVATQWLMMRIFRVPDAGYRSAIITGCGVSLLTRSDVVWLPPLAAFLAIASKFTIRVREKHVFNPANFGLVALMLATPHVWASPSQWGESGVVLAWFAILGLAVAHRSFRSDVSIAFLAAWLIFKGGRIVYLGDTLRVLGHQLTSGSLIVFAFFMISDPKTTPDHRLGRILFAVAVAFVGWYLQAFYWIQNGLLYSLFFLSPLVPLADRLLKAHRYKWARSPRTAGFPPERTATCAELSPSPSPF